MQCIRKLFEGGQPLTSYEHLDKHFARGNEFAVMEVGHDRATINGRRRQIHSENAKQRRAGKGPSVDGAVSSGQHRAVGNDFFKIGVVAVAKSLEIQGRAHVGTSAKGSHLKALGLVALLVERAALGAAIIRGEDALRTRRNCALAAGHGAVELSAVGAIAVVAQ